VLITDVTHKMTRTWCASSPNPSAMCTCMLGVRRVRVLASECACGQAYPELMKVLDHLGGVGVLGTIPDDCAASHAGTLLAYKCLGAGVNVQLLSPVAHWLSMSTAPT
jgi:hypothetical protein